MSDVQLPPMIMGLIRGMHDQSSPLGIRLNYRQSLERMRDSLDNEIKKFDHGEMRQNRRG